MAAKGFNKIVNNLMYTERGNIILSIIFGLGIATIFRKFCSGKNCYDFIGPEHDDLKNSIYSYDSNNNKCYKVDQKITSCDSKKKIINFA